MTKRNAVTPVPRRSSGGEAHSAGRPRGIGAPARAESTPTTKHSLGDVGEQDFRNLAEFLPLAIFECDVRGTVTYANSCAVEYFGYTAEDVERGIYLFDVIAPGDRARAERSFKKILDGRPIHGIEYTALRKDGTTFTAMTYSSAIVRDGRAVGIRGAVADVTARRRAEEALKESEERSRSIIEKSTNIFYVHSPDNVFTYVSPQVEKTLGFKPEEALVRWIDHITDNPANRRARELTRKAIETGVRQPPYEVELVAKDGRRVWFEVNEAPLVHDGKTVAIIGAAQDITERRKAQEDLRKLGAVVHHSSELITLATPDGTIIFINEAGEKMLGISCSGAEKPKIFDVIADGYLEIVRAEIVPALLKGGRWDGELQYRNVMSGKIIDVHAQTFAIRDRTGGTSLLFANASRDITEHKRAEKAMRERQAKLDSIFRAAPAGIGITASGIIIEVNDRICEMTGYSREELLGESARVLYATDQEYDYVRHTKDRQMTMAESGSVETCWRRNGGALIDVLVSFAPLVAGDPSAGVTFTALDITERRRAEEALRTSEKKYRQLIETLQEGIWVIDCDAKTTFVNPHMAEMLYYTTDEMSGERIFSFMDENAVDECKRYVQRCMSGGREQGDFELIRKDGERIYVHAEASVLTNENGDCVGAIVGVQDHTERRRAEEALRQSEDRFRTIVDTTSEWIWECRLDGTHIYSNPALESILGYRPDEFLEKLARDFIHDDDKAMIEDILRSHARDNTGWRDIVLRWRHKDGSYRYLESNAMPLFNQKGELVGFRGADRDVTERRRAEDERKKLETRIQQAQKLESLGVLAGGVAHDFNNILMAIRGNIEIASVALPLDSPALASLADVDRASRRAADLCKHLLAYSGKGRFATGLVDLAKMVEDIVQMLIVSVSKKAVMSLDCAPGLPLIEADESQIEQVVMNLIINASEAIGDKNGIISVSTGSIDCDRRYLRRMLLGENLPEGRYVYLEVTDNGCGMDEEAQEKIFDPFYTTKFTGRGLGLAVVLGIVRGHKGAIKISSKKDSGTSFRVLFPASPKTFAQVEECHPQAGECHGNETVLFVDDEEMVRSVSKRMLEHLGFQVLLASGGVEAIEVFRANRGRIACVILDLTMPRMDGIETQAALREISDDVAVILSSGHSKHQILKKYAKKGFAGFIEKPYELSTLGEKIRSVLGARIHGGAGE